MKGCHSHWFTLQMLQWQVLSLSKKGARNFPLGLPHRCRGSILKLQVGNRIKLGPQGYNSISIGEASVAGRGLAGKATGATLSYYSFTLFTQDSHRISLPPYFLCTCHPGFLLSLNKPFKLSTETRQMIVPDIQFSQAASVW